MKVAVLGGGISGATAAYLLRGQAEVALFESADRLGGNLRTYEHEGLLIEAGPTGFLDHEPAVLALCEDLGVSSELVRARPEAAVRYVFREGELRRLPDGPKTFLFSDCLPGYSRLRVLLEPFSRKAPGTDESVYDFARRHLGRCAAEVLVDAFVTGVCAGDFRRLSLTSAFPKLKRLEEEYGSLIKGAKGRGFGPRGVLTSFRDGLETLPRALHRALGDRARLSTPVEELCQRNGRWSVNGEVFDQVLCTLPASRLSLLLEKVDINLSVLLSGIYFAPLVVVAMAFDGEVPADDAFGFLVPRREGLRILGGLYDSSIFPGRARGPSENRRLFRILLGGQRDREAADLPDDRVVSIVRSDLERIWGSCPDPCYVRVIRHKLGIAQYEIGHAGIMRGIEERLRGLPGLDLAGASYRGVSMNACVKEAWDRAHRF
jgi:oxygen-dependent protoporphyrinogen oxidase